MPRPRTSYELNRLADIAKKREDAREAAKKAATPKAYQAEEEGGLAYFRSIENEDLFVEMPITAKAGALATTGVSAIGGLTAAAAEAIANSSLVGFEGNHKQVLRVRFTRLKATPTTRMTAWGTRVVDHIDDSFTVPFGGNTDASLKGAKTAFNTFISGAGAAFLGTRKGNYAELMYNGKVIAKRVVTA